MKTNFKSTKEVAKQIRVLPSTLSRAVWDGRIDEPLRSPGKNTFLWTDADVQRAAKVFNVNLQGAACA